MPEDGDSFTCTYCDKQFDSKRGLHIHQSQVHPDEEKQKVEQSDTTKDTEETSENNEEKEEDSSTNISAGESEDNLDLQTTEEEFSVNPGKEDSTIKMSLTTRQVAAASLIVGLLVGGIAAGAYFHSMFSIV